MDLSLLSPSMQDHLSTLKALMDSTALTGTARQTTLEKQVHLILSELKYEPVRVRQSVLDYLTQLGFGHLIEDQS